MAKGRDKKNWDYTAMVLAMIHNVNCKKSKDPKVFHPYMDSKATKVPFGEAFREVVPQQHGN